MYIVFLKSVNQLDGVFIVFLLNANVKKISCKSEASVKFSNRYDPKSATDVMGFNKNEQLSRFKLGFPHYAEYKLFINKFM